LTQGASISVMDIVAVLLGVIVQMAGLTVQNFLSAAVGISVAVAVIRGIVSRSGKSLGNFWQDLVRTVL
jgi:potassium-transporting ATPase potassium-binding subunit